MVGTIKSIEDTEDVYQHKWEFGTPRSRALKKYHNVAKDVRYNFKPELDEEAKYTLKNIDNTERKLDHKWIYAQMNVQTDA